MILAINIIIGIVWVAAFIIGLNLFKKTEKEINNISKTQD